MKLVVPGPVPTPAAAGGMLASIWGTGQLYGARISLWMLGWGDGELHLGVSSPNSLAERNAIDGVFSAVGPRAPEMLSAEAVLASARAGSEWFCARMTPAAPHVTLQDPTWWNQKDDTLYQVHTLVAAIPREHVGGIVVSFRTGPGMFVGAGSMSVFMVGADAFELGQPLVAAYGQVGRRSVRPRMHKRAVQRTLALADNGPMPKPLFKIDENYLGVYWHPPLMLDPRRTPPTSQLM